jgi:AcrR family transcriptional regulator
MSMSKTGEVPADVVEAALRAAKKLGQDVADVPLVVIAREAGLSRSTLVRRLNGTRQPLDDAVRAAGVEPGGRPPVRERAIAAAGALISGNGLAAVTLEAVAAQAHCSVHSLYAAFGGRDELLQAVFDRYGPSLDLGAALSGATTTLADTVRRLYRELAKTLSREPRVAPAMFAEVLSRPESPTARELVQRITFPRLFAVLGQWLADEVAAGRVRDLPIALLVQQMVAPIVVHTMTRPAIAAAPQIDLPGLDEACDMFAEAFLRAVAIP